MHKSFMQFVFKKLVFPFQFNEMRLYCHTKPPRLNETSDLIRAKNCTLPGVAVDGYRLSHLISYVEDLAHGTLRACSVRSHGGYSLTPLPPTFRLSHRVFSLRIS